MENNIIFILRITGDENYSFIVENNTTGKMLAKYYIIDYSTDRGCMYLVQRAEDTKKAVWTEDFIQAQNICKADYMARG